jgi:hypothetical protein
MLEIYAVANSLGIGYLHRPITCVGHIGDLVHYRESTCNLTRAEDVRLLKKIRRMITLPSSVSEEQVRQPHCAVDSSRCSSGCQQPEAYDEDRSMNSSSRTSSGGVSSRHLQASMRQLGKRKF